PTIVLLDKARDFAIASGDRDDRSAGGGDPVEFARHHQTLEFGPQRNEMDVRNAERKPQDFSLLIGKEAKQMVEPAIAYSVRKLGEFLATTDKKKGNERIATQALRRGEDGFKLVSAAEISRIADDEPVLEPPFAAQRIVERCQRPNFLVIAPIRYNADK